MVKEYIDKFKSQGDVNLEHEILVLTLVMNAPVIAQNSKIGIS
jgi:hypothetical protein